MPALTSLRIPLLALAACTAVAVMPASASAAPGSGGVTLVLGGTGKAAKSLANAGVKFGAIAPAKKRAQRIALPVRSITVGNSATVVARGGVSFKVGKRKLGLRSVRVALTAKRATVSAKAGKRRVPIFVAKLPTGKVKLDRSKTTAGLGGAKLVLTPKGAKLLRAKLGVSGVAAGALGKLAVNAGPRRRGSGGAQDGLPKAGPIANTPTVFTRPPDAVDIASASLTWRPKVSWLCYVEEANPVGGASNGVVETLDCPDSLGGPRDLVGSFVDFPFKSGWYHPPTGTAAVNFDGGVGFRYADHGIDFSSTSPEIEINGADSRAIFTFDGTGGTPYDSERGVLVDLHPNPIQKPPSGTVNYIDIPATVPEDAGASIFAGLYGANEPFGTMTVSFTTP
ncbi:MAG TPA: HtaA domain-containing protein [Thermoleophilaceae bacterium]|nr:HtaA domain-containing protein [Thermoleophilaceae bacterium]